MGNAPGKVTDNLHFLCLFQLFILHSQFGNITYKTLDHLISLC